MIQIVTVKNPFAPLTKSRTKHDGPLTITEALLLDPMPDYLPFVCCVNGEYVLRSEGWDTYVLPEDAICCFVAAAQGGGGGGGKKNPLATVLLLVVVAAVTWGAGAAIGTVGVAATATTPAVAGTGLAGALGSLTAAQIVVGIGSSLVLAGASYLINMALPPTFPKGPDAPDPAYSIIGRSNQARLGAAIEVGFGRTRFFPSICAAAYREYSDSFREGNFDSRNVGDQTLYEIYMIGYGQYDIEETELIEQATRSFPEAEVQKFEPGELITSFPSSVVDVPAVTEIEMKFALSDRESLALADVTRVTSGSDFQDEVQRITLENYVGGTFDLTVGPDIVTIAAEATYQEVREAIEGAPGIGAGNVLVSGGPLNTNPVTVRYTGDWAKTPFALMQIDTDNLDEGETQFPNYGNIPFGGFDLITDSGIEDGYGYIEVAQVGTAGFQSTYENRRLGSPFPVDGLVGMTLCFLPYPDQRRAVEASNNTGHYHINRLMVSTTITSNTENRIYWKVPDSPSTLRDRVEDDAPLRARTVNDPNHKSNAANDPPPTETAVRNCFFQVLDLQNWVGPFDINPDESFDEINEIAFDIVLPQGRYTLNDNGPKALDLQWLFEYQEIDTNGEPIGLWQPVTTDPQYIYDDNNGFGIGSSVPGNIRLSGYSSSPTRFSAKVPVPAGRYRVRGANTYLLNMVFLPYASGANKFEIPGGYPPQKGRSIGAGNSFNDLEEDRKSAGKSYWVGLRGYGLRQSQRWPDRTVMTLRVRATDNVNASTLQQFGVLATRKLQDYHGAVSSGALGTDAMTSVAITNVRVNAPSYNPNVVASKQYSTIIGTGLGEEFPKGSYVRLSGFSNAANNGEFLVEQVTDSTLTVRALPVFVTEGAHPDHVAGSRRILVDVPTILDEVAVTGANTIGKTGIGAIADFVVGGKITLSGFTNTENNIKCDITAVGIDEVTVSQTLTTETAAVGKKAHSVPPYGLVGELLDGAAAVITGATGFAGIDASAINTTEIDNVAVSIDDDGATTLEATGIGALATAAGGLGIKVTLAGFADKENQETVYVSEIAADALTVTIPPADPYGPQPTLSTLVAVTAAAGQRVLFGARKVKREGDTKISFYADQGATSTASGGGGSMAYEFPNIWTETQPSRRISTAAYHLATDANYGGGTSPDRFALEDFLERERTWDARDRYEPDDGITWKQNPIKDRYDIRLSERKLIHEHFLNMARCGRSRPIYPSGVLTFIRDEPRPVADDMFIGRNMITDSLELTATFPTDDTPDHVLVQYHDENFWDYNEVVCTDVPYSLGQLITVRRATSGSIKITHDGETTANVSATATASQVQDALELLPGVEAGSFACEGGPLGTAGVLAVYQEGLLGTNVPKLVAESSDTDPLVGNLPTVLVSYDVNPAWPGVAPARLVMPGVVQRQQAWREGMYELGSSKYRRMLVSFRTDEEGYIPSYLSRIDINDEMFEWGQHGIVTGYEYDGMEDETILTLSERPVWQDGITHVIQLRSKMGQPITDGLHQVTPGVLPDQVVISGGIDVEAIGLHVDHQSGREATFFSFGEIDNHNLKLLVTGIRPDGNGQVAIEGYYYREEGVYDADGDLEYIPPDEADILDARKANVAIKDLRAVLVLSNLLVVHLRRYEVNASWTPAPWAQHYLVESSTDGGYSWSKEGKTTESLYQFAPERLAVRDEAVEEDKTCGTVLFSGVTIIAIYLPQPDPWVAGEHDGRWVKFTSGVYNGQLFQITQTHPLGLYLDRELSPKPVDNTDTYEIVRQVQPTLHVAVRGFNGVYGPRTVVPVNLTVLGFTPDPQESSSSVVTFPPYITGSYGDDSGVPTETQVGTVTGDTAGGFRTDYCGNLFIDGRLFDGDHPTRCLYIGQEPRYHGSDATKAYLPKECRALSNGDPSILLFVQDSLLTYVAAAPGVGEFTLSGTEITLGQALEDDEVLHFIMVSVEDDSGTLAGIRIGDPCAFTGPTTTATMPFTPARPDEVLLFLNGDVLFPVDSSPGAGEFTLSGTTITCGFTLAADDVLLALGLEDTATTEAYRFRCAYFNADALPHLPLYPTQVAIAEGATMRWNAEGSSNFRLDDSGPITGVLWGDPVPTAGETRYSICLSAKPIA